MSQLNFALVLIFLLVATPAQSDCLADAAAVKTAVSASNGYREIQSIRDKDGTIKTLILDFKDKDKLRFSYYKIWGDVDVGIILGNRLWDLNKNGKFTENTTSSESGIANGMINGKKFKIEPTNGVVECSIETGDFGLKLKKFNWTQKEKSFFYSVQSLV